MGVSHSNSQWFIPFYFSIPSLLFDLRCSTQCAPFAGKTAEKDWCRGGSIVKSGCKSVENIFY